MIRSESRALLLETQSPDFYKFTILSKNSVNIYIISALLILLLYTDRETTFSGLSFQLRHDISLATYNNLQDIKAHYKKGIALYNAGEIGTAEQEFLKVLKPILSNPKIRIIPLEQIDQIKEEVLASMYHIGLIYLHDLTKVNNYAKAAAIFHYCARFSEKYNCLSYADTFLAKAYSTEKKVLNHYNIYPNEKALLNYSNKIKHYKKTLDNFRTAVADELYIIDKSFTNWEDWSSEVELIHKKIFSFFIKKTFPKDSGILQEMIIDCQEQIGSAPDGCEYSIVALGSFAAGTMTPWSDIEFAILINDNKEEYKQYFRKLTGLLNVKIVNIGESQLRWMGIESLNNFATDKEEDDWFWDHISLFGFGLDGKHWHACENPLGRLGYKKKVIGRNGIISFENREDFELIHTPYEMSLFQLNYKNNKFPIEDPYLVQSLRSVAWVIGSQALVDKYRESLQSVVSKKVVQDRISKILKSDIQKYRLQSEDINNVKKLADVKKGIYRLVDRLISAMGQYYFIISHEGEQSITLWEIIKRLKDNKIISDQEADKLKHALSIATRLRYGVYYSNFFNQGKGKLDIKESLNIGEINILWHYYVLMLEMQDVFKSRLCN